MQSSVRQEFKHTLRLSIPITIGVVCQGLFGIIDTVMIGNIIGEHALAAATLGNNIIWVPLLLVIGLCVAVPVLTAQARGAGNPEAVPGVLRHGLFISLIASVLGAALLCAFISADGLRLLGQPEVTCREAENYTYIVALSIPLAGIFQAIKSFRDANGSQWISLTWTLFGLGANIFLNWVLMTGALGFPNWGLEGAAAGTLFSRALSTIGITFHERLSFEFRKGFSFTEIRKNLRIAVPSTFHIFFEAGLFIITPFFMGWISAAAIAANQVVMMISTLVYSFPLGLAQALSIRVGEAYGARDYSRIRKIFGGALFFTLLFMLICAFVFIRFRNEIPLLCNLGPDAAKMASSLMLVVCAYMLFDGFQTISAGVLRGINDVRIIAVAAFVSYWIIGCPVALILGFPLGMEGLGIWIGLAAGLATIACILGWRIHKDLQAGTENPAIL